MANREFDIIVYGATGYTGRLVAEHFVREYGNTAKGPKWAMARMGNGHKINSFHTKFVAIHDFTKTCTLKPSTDRG